MDKKSKFLLLQVNDALFPIGGYSHSYGLETYIQKELVTNAAEAEAYIRNKLTQNLLYNELFFCRLAWERAQAQDMEGLQELEEVLEAGKVPSEIREASKKMGSRFAKTLKNCGIVYETPVFLRYLEKKKERQRTSCHSLRNFLQQHWYFSGRLPGTFSLCPNVCHGDQLCKKHTFKPDHGTADSGVLYRGNEPPFGTGEGTSNRTSGGRRSRI